MLIQALLAADSAFQCGISWIAIACLLMGSIWSVHSGIQRRQWLMFFLSAVLFSTFLNSVAVKHLQSQGIGYDSVPPSDATRFVILLMSLRDWHEPFVIVCGVIWFIGIWKYRGDDPTPV